MSSIIAASYLATLVVAFAGRLQYRLNAETPLEFSQNELNYIKDIKALYVPTNSQHEKDKKGMERYAHAPFHNLDHANNIEEFATWYTKKAGIRGKDQKLLVLSAISHDVLHSGGDNNEAVVTKTFIPAVHRVFPETSQHDLAWFARDIWKELSAERVTREQMRLALGANHAKSSAEVPALLVERTPQEVVHAWVAIQYLKRHSIDVEKSKFVINILMTSITLHFRIRFAGPPSVEKDYVNSMCTDSLFGTFSCGMLLHLLDMGWPTQTLCAKEGGCKNTQQTYKKAPGLFFGPRFLAESKRYKQVKVKDVITPIKSLDQVWTAEADFIDMVIAFVENLQHARVFFGDRKDIPAALIASARFHKGVVKSSEFTQEVRKVVNHLHTILPQEYEKKGPFFDAA